MFWFQALRKPHFENKGNFWINCVCIKAFVSWYTHKEAFAFIAYLQEDIHAMAYSQADIRIITFAYSQGDICIHYIPKRAFVFIVFPSGHSHSLHPYKGHLHHGMHQWDIRIMACTIRTSASWHTPKRTFASWHTHKGAFTSWHTYMNIYIMAYLHEHLHHDIPTRGHLHHDIPA